MMGNIFLPLQRVIMLQGIEQAAGRELSNEMIQRLLAANGHRCSISEVNEWINWLENRGYVKATRMGDSGFILVHITRPGIEVATSLVRVEGIEAPPEE
jgi:Fe2+ or Zn2+ uptake regulation protein